MSMNLTVWTPPTGSSSSITSCSRFLFIFLLIPAVPFMIIRTVGLAQACRASIWNSRHFLAPSVTLHTWGTSSSTRGLTAGCTGAVSGSISSERRSAWQNQVTLPISFCAPCVVYDPVLGHVVHHVGVGPVVLCQATDLNWSEVGCSDP